MLILARGGEKVSIEDTLQKIADTRKEILETRHFLGEQIPKIYLDLIGRITSNFPEKRREIIDQAVLDLKNLHSEVSRGWDSPNFFISQRFCFHQGGASLDSA